MCSKINLFLQKYHSLKALSIFISDNLICFIKCDIIENYIIIDSKINKYKSKEIEK